MIGGDPAQMGLDSQQRQRDRRAAEYALWGDPAAGDGSQTHCLGYASGLVAGAVVGWFAGRATGAVVGGFVGVSTMADVLRAAWQVVFTRSARDVVPLPEALLTLLVTAGSLAGGLIGYALGDSGGRQVWYLFAGMVVAGLGCALLTVPLSMCPFRIRTPTWLGPLVTGLCGWGLYSVWHSPWALGVAFLAGSVLTGRICELAGARGPL
jgi:hypothetical protein